MPLKDLAAQYGVTYTTLWRWRRKAGAKCLTTGEHHWTAKLTKEQVAEIRKLQQEGVRQKDLAKKYGVAQSTISHIINYVSWYA